jgi:hypothetical protein
MHLSDQDSKKKISYAYDDFSPSKIGKEIFNNLENYPRSWLSEAKVTQSSKMLLISSFELSTVHALIPMIMIPYLYY